jgi:trans-aconitate methyltransferase
MTDLDVIALKYVTDKYIAETDIGHTKIYAELFEPLRNKPIDILEIGIANGGSLKMWADYFPFANVSGIDINPNSLQYQNNQITVFIGNQNDSKFLDKFSCNEYDVIIDDGSHYPIDQQISFTHLFDCVAPLGFYIIEDVCVAYMNEYKQDGSLNIIEYFKSLIDSIVKRENNIKSIQFYYNLIVIQKGDQK